MCHFHFVSLDHGPRSLPRALHNPRGEHWTSTHFTGADTLARRGEIPCSRSVVWEGLGEAEVGIAFSSWAGFQASRGQTSCGRQMTQPI